MNSFWHQSPLIRVALSFISGIGLGTLMPVHPKAYLILIGAFGLVVLVIFWYKFKRQSHRHRYQFGGVLLFGFMLAGALLFSKHQQSRAIKSVVPEGKRVWLAEVSNYPFPTQKAIKLELSVLGIAVDSGNRTTTEINVLAYGQKHAGWDTLVPGDQIVFYAEISQFDPPINPGQFDYGKYLKNHGICGMVFLKDEAAVFRPSLQKFSLTYSLLRIQAFFVGQMGMHQMAERELGVASALILGNRSLVDKDVKTSFADAGVVHILAVSGLHVGIIYIILIWIFDLFFKDEKWKWAKLGLIILLLWVYAGITGMSPSVMRAATMFSFVAIGKAKGKRGSIYNMLAVSAIILLVLNPYLLFEVGFQLSYAAVIGIAMFYPPIYSLWYVRQKWLDKIWSLIVVSFSAQLATFPLAVYYFDQFPNYFLLSNLLIIPMATIGLYLGLILISFSWVPYLGEVLSQLVEWLFWLLISVVDILAKLPMAKTEHIHFSAIVVISTYVFIYLLFKFFQSPIRWKVWWPIGAAIVLVFFFVHRKVQVYHTSEVVVLAGAKAPLILIQHRNKAWLLCQDTSQSALEKQAFYLSGYLGLKGIDQLKIINAHDSLSWNSFEFINNHLAFLLAQQPNADFKAYNGIEILNAESTQFTADFLSVLSPNISDFRKKRLINLLEKEHHPYWDMTQQGVIRISFE